MRTAARLSKSRVGIVGAGPCGMTLAMLLNKLGFEDFKLFEAKSREQIINSHPAAHYINSRSLEIFDSLGDLGNNIRQHSEDLQKYRYYRYCRRIGDFTYQVTDQLSEASLAALAAQSDVKPVHMPQNRLCELMIDHLERTNSGQKLCFSSKVDKLVMKDDGVGKLS